MKSVFNIDRCFSIVFATSIALFALVANAEIHFDNVTSTAGPFHTGESWGAAWGDLNGDKRPELYVNNHRQRSGVYRNNGDGTFTNVVLTVDRERVWLSDLRQDVHAGTWGDFDNDGDLDLLSARSSSGGRGQLFVNTGGIFVEEKGSELGLNGFSGGRFGAWLDYDNDGLLDIGAMRASSAKIFKQQGGRFSDTTSSVGMYRECYRNGYLQLLDQTGDGQPEIICGTVTSYPEKIFDTSSDTFQDITSTIPIDFIVNDVALADFDNDGKMDILKVMGRVRSSQAKKVNSGRLEAYLTVSDVSGEKGYTFEADGTISIPLLEFERESDDRLRVYIGSDGWNPASIPFTLDPSISSTWGLKQARSQPGVYIGYDTALKKWTILATAGSINSRDSYIVVDGTNLTEPTLFGLKPSELPEVPKLVMDTGSGYEQVYDFGIPEVWCNSVTAGDFDNDMDVDVFMACRGSVENIPNRLFENQGNGSFIEIPAGGGASGSVGVGLDSGAGSSESVVMADYDVDGFLDLFVTNGALLVPVDAGGPDELFHNQGNGNNWIEIDLEGTISNRDGIGAKVYATAGSITQFREQNGGYHRWSQNHMRIHFGLAANESVDIRVEWPSGNVDQFNGVAANNLYHLKESRDIQAVTLGPVPSFPTPQPGDECGSPAYDKREDKKMFLWKDCTSGDWNFRVTAGGSTNFYSGEFASDDLISSVVGFSFEGGDNIDTTDPYKISYELYVGGSGHDGITFQARSATKTCLFVDTPSDVELLVGAKMLPAEFPLNLATLNSEGCSTISISDVTVNENSGSAEFAVSLSPASSGTVTVEYTTRNGTATDGQDYVGTTVALPIQFASGETLQTITVPILDDTMPEGMEMFEVVLSNPINAQIGDGTGDGIILDDENNSACGMPAYNPRIEQGAFLWKDCDGSNTWHFIVTAGGSATRVDYVGQFDSDTEFTSVIGQFIEGGDTLDYTTDPTTADFFLKVRDAGWDGFDFTTPAGGSSVCLDMALPPGSQVFVGASKSPVNLPLDLETLGVCSIPPPDDECGAPSYDLATEQGLFLWKDCEGTGMWHVMATAGGSATRVNYAGLVDSEQPFNMVTENGIEGGDTLDYITDTSLIDFYLKVIYAGWDGFAFDFSAGSNTCFDLSLPASSGIFLGSGKIPKMVPLNLDTLGACP